MRPRYRRRPSLIALSLLAALPALVLGEPSVPATTASIVANRLDTSVRLGAEVARPRAQDLVERDRILAAMAVATALSPAQERLATSALALLGRHDLRVDGVAYPFDCSGAMLATLRLAGIAVEHEYLTLSGNGVARLHDLLVRRGLTYDMQLPELGDLVFWDNTWDANGNGRWDDPLTHTALVIWVDPDGTVTYLHEDYRQGMVLARMNLFFPDRRTLTYTDGSVREANAPMRQASDIWVRPGTTLSGQLFRDFGRLHLLIDSGNIELATPP